MDHPKRLIVTALIILVCEFAAIAALVIWR